MKIFFYVVLLILAVLIGLALKSDPGYVLLAFHRWTVEMPLWFAVIALVLFIFIVHYLVRLIFWLGNLSDHWRSWREHRRYRKAYTRMGEGLLNLHESRWKLAEQNFLQSVKSSRIPVINYLGAAKAAYEQKAYDRCDRYLCKAHDVAPEESIAIGITQANMQMSRGQYDLALAVLDHLKKYATKHVGLLNLYVKVYLALGDWQHIDELLPVIEKQEALSTDEIAELKIEIYKHLLNQPYDQVDELNCVWKKMSHHLRHDPALVMAYCKALVCFGESEKAGDLITRFLDQDWNDLLCELYGLLELKSPEKQLKKAESWLQLHRDNPVLLLALGRMAFAFKHWAKAKEYALLSLHHHKAAGAYELLGQISEKMNDLSEALGYYREAAGFCSHPHA